MTLPRRAAALFGLVLSLMLASAAPASAQAGGGLWWVVGSLANETPAPGAINGPDYTAWEVLARRAEAATADPGTPSNSLATLRNRIAEYRQQFQTAQGTNASRIATVREQIAALGPAPEEGAEEPAEIAQRRATLNEQLAELTAPGVTAAEARQRAEGLIAEIDQILRDRQADALMQLWPAPVNPANWPAGLSALTNSAMRIVAEVQTSWGLAARREALSENLPIILGYALVALLLLLRGRHWMEQLTLRLQDQATLVRGREVWALLASLGQVVAPVLGVYALVQALAVTGLAGPVGNAVLRALPEAGLMLFTVRWLGGRIFPVSDAGYSPLTLVAERRREGRFHASMLGLLMAIDILRPALVNPAAQTDAANAVITFPMLAVAGLLLFRIGQLMRRHFLNVSASEGGAGYYDRLIRLGGRAAMVVGIGGGALAAIGYVAAATAIVYPAVMSLGLAGLLVVLQRLIAGIYAAITRAEGDAGDGLVPVLASFTLTLLSLPLFALIWGVRDSELVELYGRFREGFSLGDTRISPANFLTFVLVFAIVFTLTRLVQGALGSTVLPKTRLDKGAQKSLLSGLGYLGVFLAAIIAFSSAGIDLSGLAIVAGALSVGIGFGLQNIVSNFVSGIILLVERPVSEGDWIEVGGVMGTVRSISVRSTRIETFDRNDVIVPNADLISGQVTNWTRFNMTGRLLVPVGVAYGTDTRLVEKVLMEIAEAQPLVSMNPPPQVLFMGFGADSLNFEIRVILSDVNFKLRVHSDINHEIARRFREEGIEIPFAQRDIWLRNPEVLAGAVRPPAPAANTAAGPASVLPVAGQGPAAPPAAVRPAAGGADPASVPDPASAPDPETRR